MWPVQLRNGVVHLISFSFISIVAAILSSRGEGTIAQQVWEEPGIPQFCQGPQNGRAVLEERHSGGQLKTEEKGKIHTGLLQEDEFSTFTWRGGCEGRETGGRRQGRGPSLGHSFNSINQP